MSSSTGSIAGTANGHRPHHAATRLRRVGAVLGLGAAIAAGLVAAPLASPAAAATAKPIAVPTTPTGLPAGIEDLSPYVGQVSCDPTGRPGTLALARLLSATYPGTGYLLEKPCGSESIASEHSDGRALDWTVSARTSTQKAQAEAFLGWLLATDSAGRPFANARRLGVMYVIWNNRIWSSHDPLSGWQPYSTCAAHPQPSADAVCHRNRLHISLSWAGALQRTSYWSKEVAAVDYGPCRPADLNWAPAYRARNASPCPTYPVVSAPARASANVVALARFSGASVGPDDSGPVVTAVQIALKVTADGTYGPYTADAVSAFQAAHKIDVSGRVDAATWRALLTDAGIRVVQRTPLPQQTIPSAKNLTKYKSLVLKYGDRGEAVLALQKRLKVTPSAWFGPKTKSAVVAFQKSKRLPATGIVNAATWKALGA